MRRNGYSRAFRDFEQSHKRANALYRIECARFRDPPRTSDLLAVDAIRSGITVLLTASIEQYVKAAIEEYVEEIGKIAVMTTHPNLPPWFNEHNDLIYISVISKSRKNKSEKLREVRRVSTLIAQSLFVPESFSQTQANPGPQTIKTLLSDFGISDPFRVLEGHFARLSGARPASGSLQTTLDGLVIARNQVAHGTSNLGRSRLDILNWIKFTYTFSKCIDNALRDRAIATTNAI